jgi:hypothetical protein
MPQNPLEPREFNSSKYTLQMDRGQNYWLYCFLTLITLFLYLPIYYENFVRKINIISKDAFREHNKDVWFSKKLMFTTLALCFPTLILVFISAIYLNLDALPDVIGFFIIGTIAVSGIIAAVLALHAQFATLKRLKLLARHYDSRDMIVLLEYSSIWWLERNCFRAFDVLVDEYNMRHNQGVYRP